MPIWFRIDPFFSGQTVVIIGGGPSVTVEAVRKVALSRLNSECRVIAVNDSALLAWWGDWCHGADYKWWAANTQSLSSFDGIKTTIDELVPGKWGVKHFKVTGVDGFDPEPTCIRTGNNSGYQAMHCAIAAGAKRIVLLGFDMMGPHWSGAEADCVRSEAMSPHFTSLLPVIEERGIEVFNASDASLLVVFKYLPLDEALRAAGVPAD